MVQMYWTVWRHGLSCQQDAETTAGSAAVLRLGLTGCMFLLVVTGWFTPAWAAQVNLAWNATTTYTDDTPVIDTDLVVYYLSLQDSAGGLPQRVDVGNQTTYTLTDLTEGLTYTITVTATDTVGLENSPRRGNHRPLPRRSAGDGLDPSRDGRLHHHPRYGYHSHKYSSDDHSSDPGRARGGDHHRYQCDVYTRDQLRGYGQFHVYYHL